MATNEASRARENQNVAEVTSRIAGDYLERVLSAALHGDPAYELRTRKLSAPLPIVRRGVRLPVGAILLTALCLGLGTGAAIAWKRYGTTVPTLVLVP